VAAGEGVSRRFSTVPEPLSEGPGNVARALI
jgi:hypothetical protein